MAKYKTEAEYNRQIIDAFKSSDDPEILIVVLLIPLMIVGGRMMISLDTWPCRIRHPKRAGLLRH